MRFYSCTANLCITRIEQCNNVYFKNLTPHTDCL